MNKQRSSARSGQSSPLIHKSSVFAASTSTSSQSKADSSSAQPSKPPTSSTAEPVAHLALRDEARGRELFGWDDLLYDSRFPK
ncbi:hypothetical protein IFO70_27395 [Phormidium tenue FACHB-886]|nr:hypothetical protein [Phormidium tenue FACHB-886]